MIVRWLVGLARWFHWALTGLYPITLPAPAIPDFTPTGQGSTMTLNFAATAALADASLSYSFTVTPAGGAASTQSVAGGAKPAPVPNVPAGSVTISEYVKDADGNAVSPLATKVIDVVAAPAIPAVTVTADAPPAA